MGEESIATTSIGIGAWLGTIMLFNVWVLIWPNQKKVLGIVSATDDEKASAKRVAFLASRTNTMLSIPMLMFMMASNHGLPSVLRNIMFTKAREIPGFFIVH